jgi:hypothetical protein
LTCKYDSGKAQVQLCAPEGDTGGAFRCACGEPRQICMDVAAAAAACAFVRSGSSRDNSATAAASRRMENVNVLNDTPAHCVECFNFKGACGYFSIILMDGCQ